jgi:nitrogen permease regulator 2-like protein
MPSDGDSFLPRIQSVFYAVFDLRQGPKIVYQVPEGLIAVSNSGGVVGSTSLSSSSSPAPSTPNGEVEGPTSRNSSSSLRSPGRERSMQSPQKRSTSSNRTLFNFDDISSYVIPRSALCGRLVICATRNHRIIGFPVELRGDYERNYFRYNLCFVFERTADLSCYEPIVRKVSRVLTACEVHCSFFSLAREKYTDRYT